MKLQIFLIKKFQSWTLIILFFSSNWLGFCSQERWELLSASVFKRVLIHKYIKKQVIRHINGNFRDFSSDDNESNENKIRTSEACVSKYTGHYFSNEECTQKSVVFFQLCLKCA